LRSSARHDLVALVRAGAVLKNGKLPQPLTRVTIVI